MESAAGKNFKVIFSVKCLADGRPVYVKSDGQRFRQNRTVKLRVDTVYRIDVSFKPPRQIERINVHGNPVEVCEKSRDSTASAYSVHLSTNGQPPSKKGHRDELPVIVTLKDSGDLSLCPQVKFYKEKDIQHCEWGSNLHCIEYDCVTNEMGINIVNKETFR